MLLGGGAARASWAGFALVSSRLHTQDPTCHTNALERVGSKTSLSTRPQREEAPRPVGAAEEDARLLLGIRRNSASHRRQAQTDAPPLHPGHCPEDTGGPRGSTASSPRKACSLGGGTSTRPTAQPSLLHLESAAPIDTGPMGRTKWVLTRSLARWRRRPSLPCETGSGWAPRGLS